MSAAATTRNRRLLAVVAVAFAVVAGAVISATSLATSSTPSRMTRDGTVAGVALQRSFVNVVRSVSPSVQIEDQTGLGSGLVFDARGDVVTNNHVVSGATSFTVTSSSGKRYPAKLAGAFPGLDYWLVDELAQRGLLRRHTCPYSPRL
jgi:S1-C subfamily serine protease